MKLIIKKSFQEDIKNFDLKIYEKVLKIIEFLEKSDFLDFINLFDVKKNKWHKIYYRIRVWDYRIWVIYENDTITFVRIKLRKDIYKIFP